MKTRNHFTKTIPQTQGQAALTSWSLFFSSWRTGACKYLIITDRAITLKIVPTIQSGLLWVLLNMITTSFNLEGKKTQPTKTLPEVIHSFRCLQLFGTDAPSWKKYQLRVETISPCGKLMLLGANIAGFSRITDGIDVLSFAPPSGWSLYSTKDLGCKRANKVFGWLILFILSQVKDTCIALKKNVLHQTPRSLAFPPPALQGLWPALCS